MKPFAAARPWAVALALLLHLLPLAWLWTAPARPLPGAVAAGSGGIELALGPSGGTPGTSTPEGMPVAEAVPAVEPAAAPPALQPEPVAAAAPEMPEMVEPAPAVPETITAPAAEPVAAAPVEQRALAAPAAEMATTAPKTMPTREAAVAGAPPRPEPRPARKPAAPPAPQERRQPARPSATASATATRPAAAAAPAAAAEDTTARSGGHAGGRSGNGAAPDAGSGDATPGGGDPGAAPDYLARLVAWLERHKEYPRTSRLRREEGTVLLRFTIDRGGRLLSWRIERGSGHEPLDREAGAMIRRADPLPAMPAEMPQERLELTVPVQFRLR
jgi:protein TonB